MSQVILDHGSSLQSQRRSGPIADCKRLFWWKDNNDDASHPQFSRSS
jgi:hypothetical protein